MNIKSANTLKAMETIFSHKYGLVNYASTSDMRGLSVSTNISTCMIGNTIPMYMSVVDNVARENLGGGGAASLSRERSRVKAFGEFIERHCGIYGINERFDNTCFECYDNLSSGEIPCVNPIEIISYADSLYADPRFPYGPYSSHSAITWVKGIDLLNKNEVWLPAQKVFMDYYYPKDEVRYVHSLSTGLACGTGFHQAALGAIYEVIERDSFMLTWLLKAPGTRIEMDKMQSQELRAIYNHIMKHLVGEDSLHVYDISKTNGAYTALTFIRNDLPEAYGLIVSTASHTSPEVALFKSLEELCQSYSFAYHHLCSDDERKIQHMNKDDIDTLHKHFFYYSTGRHSHNIDFIASSGETVRLSEMKDHSKNADEECLEYVVDIFRQQGQSVYIADITRPEIRTSGFCVIKAIIPSYVDLNPLHHNFRFQKGTRLSIFQEKYGMELNDEPHPFP